MILVAWRADISIQGDGTRQLNGAGIKEPTVRRKEPRPTENLTRSQGLNGEHTTLGGE